MVQLRSDPNAIEEEHFQIILVQTEVERMRFIVRSYMRTRIHKVGQSCVDLADFLIPFPPARQVEKFAHYILGDPEVQARLSFIELKHAQS